MVRLQLIKWVIGVVAVLAGTAEGVQISERVALFLKPGYDDLNGNVMFRVQNLAKAPVTQELPLLLPKEAVAWQAVHGFTLAETAGGSSGVVLKKEFPVGELFMAAEFVAPAHYGKATLTLLWPYENGELGVFVNQGGLEFERWSSACSRASTTTSGRGEEFATLTCEGLHQGDLLELTLAGVPEGRARFAVLGGVSALLLLIGAIVLILIRRRIADDSVDLGA